MKKLSTSLFLLILSLAGCREQPRWVADLQAGGKPLAAYHKPPFQLYPARLEKEDTRLSEQMKRYLAGHSSILPSIASGLKRREREITDDFKPGPVMADDQGNLAMVYFGTYDNPVIMAGIKVLFVFDKKRDLTKIYIYEVPLE